MLLRCCGSSRLWTLRALQALGIDTLGELAAADLQWLVQHFGASYGAWLHAAAHGRDDRPVVTHSEPKSISRETTFERDLHPRHDRQELGEIFTRLCVRLAEDLARKGYVGRTVGVKLRYDDFRTVTRDVTLEQPVGEAVAIRRAGPAHWPGRARCARCSWPSGRRGRSWPRTAQAWPVARP